MQSYGDFRLFTTILQFFDQGLCDKWRFSTTVVFFPSESVVWAKKKLPFWGSLFLCIREWVWFSE